MTDILSRPAASELDGERGPLAGQYGSLPPVAVLRNGNHETSRMDSLPAAPAPENAASPEVVTPWAPPPPTCADRYGRLTLEGIEVRRAASPEDLSIVAALRREGFSRVTETDPDHIAWLDKLDQQAGVFSLIAKVDGKDVGTMRVQDGRRSVVELAKYVDLDAYLAPNDLPLAQFSRLSITKAARSRAAMLGIFKAAWLWCYQNGITTIVISTPKWSKPIYDFLLFRPLGIGAEFSHPFATNAPHYVLRLQASAVEPFWRENNHPLCRQFFEVHHPNLVVAW